MNARKAHAAWGILVLMLAGLVQAQDPNLVGYWPLDADVTDASGNGLNGSLQGAASLVDGLIDGAVSLNGGYVNIDGYPGLGGAPALTTAAWVKTTGNGVIVGWGNNGAATRYEFRINAGRLRFEHNAGNIQGNTVLNDGEWHHAACVNIAGATISYPDVKLYLDGVDDTRATSDPDTFKLSPGPDLAIGRSPSLGRVLIGLVDDVRLYDRVLTEAEIQTLARRPLSYAPNPADGGSFTGDFAVLTWTPGGFAAQHDVYFGTVAAEVLAGTGDTYQGRQPNPLFFVQSVVPGQVYYWRIDDVELDGTTIHTGPVWRFTVTPLVSHEPAPADGGTYVVPAPTLRWKAGAKAVLNEVYFSDNLAAVNDGAAAAGRGQQTATRFVPGDLTPGTTYYWRVDAVEADLTTVRRGAIWSFTTRPADPAITDPDLKGWWKMDEGVHAVTVFDSSGHGAHGSFVGNPRFLDEGVAGGALELSLGSYVETEVLDVNSNTVTVSGWVLPYGPQPDWASVLQHRGNITCGLNIGHGNEVAYHWASNALSYNFVSGLSVPADEWSFLAMVIEPSKARLYLNATDHYADNFFDHAVSDWQSKPLLGGDYHNNAARGITGALDDVRVYTRSLSAEEIATVMRADLALAWSLSPIPGLVADQDTLTELSWEAGDGATAHDVYLGTDREAVKVATAEDTTGLYRGRRTTTTYVPDGGFVPGTSYFWRVDEVAQDGSLARGSVRGFTVTPYLILDDFEAYSSRDGEQIWQAWADGFGGNGTGSRVDYENADGLSLVETANVHGGRQAMPFQYTNDGSFADWQGTATNARVSEAAIVFDPPQDWTRHASSTLALYASGRMASPTSATADPGTGIHTVVGAGNNLNTAGDHFHFMYTPISGDGVLMARLDLVGPEPGPTYAKVGLMIRESLDPGAPFAALHFQPLGRVQLQSRPGVAEALAATNSPSGSVAAAPVWLRLERSGSTLFKAAYSLDGTSWVETFDEGFGPAEMWATLPIEALAGLWVTASSGDPTVTVTGTFSQVTWKGSPVNLGAAADVDLPYNHPEDLYVVVEDRSGKTARVAHPDNPTAVNATAWTPWFISLADEVAGQGVNLSQVTGLRLGVGDPAVLGGRGVVLVDDIRLYSDDTLPDPNDVVE